MTRPQSSVVTVGSTILLLITDGVLHALTRVATGTIHMVVYGADGTWRACCHNYRFALADLCVRDDGVSSATCAHCQNLVRRWAS
jgi:hypothetical protein